VLLHHPPTSGLVSTDHLRHRCRHPRCGLKLRHGPTDNPRAAFCTAKCFDSYFRRRCLVCERPIDRKNERRQLCGRARCRKQFQRHRERFYPPWYRTSVLSPNGLGNADKPGLKSGSKSGRAFRQIAGPELGPTSLRLASLPLDPEFAARIARANSHYFEALKKSKRAAARKALIKRHHAPVNVLGGYQFSDAPVMDLSPTDLPSEWATQSRWQPTGAGADVPDIPDFLRREPVSAVTPTIAAKEPLPCPAAAHLVLAE